MAYKQNIRPPSEEEVRELLSDYQKANTKVEVDPSWTKHLLATHPVQYITTVGKVNRRLMTNIAPFATCLDTSYDPPYVTISVHTRQHSIIGQPKNKGRMNTHSNIIQNGLFIVNTPGAELLNVLDIVAIPYERQKLEDKIQKACLTKGVPCVLPKDHDVYPPIINECLAHLECEVIDIHRPRGSDHYNITGKVVGASYDVSLGEDLDEVRKHIAERSFHHFGPVSGNPTQRYIAMSSLFTIQNETRLLVEKNGEKK